MRQSLLGFLLGALLLGGGSTVYSAFQIQLPSRTSLKVTPDAANVWSWHKEIVLQPNQTNLRERVLVDFDSNGRMDTEDPEVRVTVTDLQFVAPGTSGFTTLPRQLNVWLVDRARRRWSLLSRVDPPFSGAYGAHEHQHLVTPIVLPVGSDLHVEFEYASLTGPCPVTVNLVGRVVVL